MVTVRSPSLDKSAPARSDLPMSLWISWDLPLLLFSREVRGIVEPGNIEYSAVIQPCPLPDKNPGTLSSMLAEHKTFVFPVDMITQPAAYSIGPRCMSTARSSSFFLPSILIGISLVNCLCAFSMTPL